jgi:hypothetical protein
MQNEVKCEGCGCLIEAEQQVWKNQTGNKIGDKIFITHSEKDCLAVAIEKLAAAGVKTIRVGSIDTYIDEPNPVSKWMPYED